MSKSSVMHKKETLLLILKELFGIFDLAEPLFAYIESTPYDEKIVEGLIGLITNEIESVADDEKRKFLTTIVARLEVMRAREMVDLQSDQKEAAYLLKYIQ